MDDSQAMALALAQANMAAQAAEVPVGAVVLRHGQLVAAAHNLTVTQTVPTAHAEILAIGKAATALGNYRLDDCELFVTLEPCVMCAGAIFHARLKRVVFAATDPKTGAAGSVINVFDNAQLNHQTRVQGGLMAEQSQSLLREFFQQKRASQGNPWPLRDDALRTPDACFEKMAPSPYASHYLNDLPSLAGLRLHYLQAGEVGPSTTTTLCLHGPAEWSLVWLEKMFELASLQQCVLAPDLIGFGRSDKPKKQAMHSLAWHTEVLQEWIARLGLARLSVLVSPGMKDLAQALQARLPQQIEVVTVTLPGHLTRQEIIAPYPDQGHCAGWRAFGVKAQHWF